MNIIFELFKTILSHKTNCDGFFISSIVFCEKIDMKAPNFVLALYCKAFSSQHKFALNIHGLRTSKKSV